MPLSHVRPQNARHAVSPAPSGSRPPKRRVSNLLCVSDPLIGASVTHKNDCRPFAAGSPNRQAGRESFAGRSGACSRTADRKLSGIGRPGHAADGEPSTNEA
jgi:hypothetical protein